MGIGTQAAAEAAGLPLDQADSSRRPHRPQASKPGQQVPAGCGPGRAALPGRVLAGNEIALADQYGTLPEHPPHHRRRHRVRLKPVSPPCPPYGTAEACPVPCRAKARNDVHRWYLPAGYLEDWCAAERVLLDDARPWVRRASDGKVIPARHWGFPDDEVDDPGVPRRPTGGRRADRPLRAALHRAAIQRAAPGAAR